MSHGKFHPYAIHVFLGWLMFGPIAWAEFSTHNVRAGLDISADFKGISFTDDDAISIGTQAAGSLFSSALQGVNPGLGLDALIVESNLVIFSADIGFSVGASDFSDEDLISYDVGTGLFSTYWDGSAAGLDERADLDAATLIPGTDLLLFSIDITLTNLVAGESVSDEDIIQWDGLTATRLFDGQNQLGIAPSADLNALHSDGTNLFFSLDKTSFNQRAGVTGNDEDVWQVDTNTFTVSLLSGFGFPPNTDIHCLDEPIFSDSDALSDYEEITGVDDPATTVPGTSIPLDPSGLITDSLKADTDGDGSDDDEELIAGTDPTNRSSQLVITGIQNIGGTKFVTWASVTNRQYRVTSTDQANADYSTEEASAILSTGTNTTLMLPPPDETQLFYRVTIDLF